MKVETEIKEKVKQSSYNEKYYYGNMKLPITIVQTQVYVKLKNYNTLCRFLHIHKYFFNQHRYKILN